MLSRHCIIAGNVRDLEKMILEKNQVFWHILLVKAKLGSFLYRFVLQFLLFRWHTVQTRHPPKEAHLTASSTRKLFLGNHKYTEMLSEMHVKRLLVCLWISLDLEDKGKCQKEKSTINIGGLSLKRKIIVTTTRSGTQRDTHREKPPHKKLSLFVFSPEISKSGGVKNKSCF